MLSTVYHTEVVIREWERWLNKNTRKKRKVSQRDAHDWVSTNVLDKMLSWHCAICAIKKMEWKEQMKKGEKKGEQKEGKYRWNKRRMQKNAEREELGKEEGKKRCKSRAHTKDWREQYEREGKKITWDKEVGEEKKKDGGAGTKEQRSGGRRRERRQRGNEGDSREKNDYNAH